MELEIWGLEFLYMNTRVGDIGIFPFAWSRHGALRKALVIGLIVIGLLLYVAGKVKIVQLGYQLENMKREKQELERVNRSLRIEASSLSSPARIEEIAVKRLGMVRPAKGNIVVVKRKGLNPNSK